MKRVDEFQFYRLANRIHPLLSLKQANLNSQIGFDLINARSWLQWLMRDHLVPLVVSRQACASIIKAIDEIVPDEDSAENDPRWEAPVEQLKLNRVISTVRDFETVFAAEVQSLNTYFISQHGIYSTADLIEHAELAFDDDVRSAISDGAKKDFREAGRCLAFELSTACGFHTMRATESVLRQWHRMVCKPAGRSPEWAQCVNELKSNGADTNTLGVMDQIRALHRNPVMHPEDFLTVSEAKTLFGIATSAITAMGIQIAKLQEMEAVEALEALNAMDEQNNQQAAAAGGSE